eukprot:1388204-Amorphochlora_amoeboformis.AAC.1
MEESKPDSEVRKEEEKGEKDTSGLYPPVAPLNSDYLLNKPKLDKGDPPTNSKPQRSFPNHNPKYKKLRWCHLDPKVKVATYHNRAPP